MVYLNNIIPINIKELKKEMMKNIEEEIDNELWYLDEINKDRKENVKKNILKNVKNKMDTDNFIYMVMDDNRCSFKHQRGNKDGHFCCKNITRNGDKKKYVCRVHNKNHIPIPKSKINLLNEKTLENKIIENDKIQINIDKYENIHKNKQIIEKKNIQAVSRCVSEKEEIEYRKNRNNNKIKKKTKFTKNIIYLGNYGNFLLSNIINNYNMKKYTKLFL